MNEELKPVNCGCGGEAKIYSWNEEDDVQSIHYHTICMNCGIETNAYDTEIEAIEAWNRAMGAERKIAYDPKTKIYYPEGYVSEKLGGKNHE